MPEDDFTFSATITTPIDDYGNKRYLLTMNLCNQGDTNYFVYTRTLPASMWKWNAKITSPTLWINCSPTMPRSMAKELGDEIQFIFFKKKSCIEASDIDIAKQCWYRKTPPPGQYTFSFASGPHIIAESDMECTRTFTRDSSVTVTSTTSTTITPTWAQEQDQPMCVTVLSEELYEKGIFPTLLGEATFEIS